MKFTSALLLTLAAAVAPASATVLTFDIGSAVSGLNIPQAYGDRVTTAVSGSFSYGTAGGFTPNIVLDYSASSQPNLQMWVAGFSDLTNVIENETDGDNGYTIKLTADAGFLVRLDGFDLGNYGGQITVPGLRIEDGQGTVLFSRVAFTLAISTQPHQDYDFPGGLSASELNIFVDTTGLDSASDNVGLDNIAFGQTAIPEPSAFAFGVIGFLGLGMRRSRRKRNG